MKPLLEKISETISPQYSGRSVKDMVLVELQTTIAEIKRRRDEAKAQIKPLQINEGEKESRLNGRIEMANEILALLEGGAK